MTKHYNYHKQRNSGNDPLANFFKLLFLPFQNLFRKKLDNNFIQRKWLEIEKLLSENSNHSLKTAVLESDKLFDYYLKNLGYKGLTMGERLKSAKGKLGKNNNDVWQAHILRNKVVHESEFVLKPYDARTAIRSFKKSIIKL